MSQVLAKKGSQPEWWLEGGSFPIKVLDAKKVDVLAHSEVMQQRYGASPVVVHFRHDDGEVIHVVSHFYRQMATQNANVAAVQAVDGYEGLSGKDKAELKSSLGGVSSGDVESSYAFQRMTSNIVTGKLEAQRRAGQGLQPDPCAAYSGFCNAPTATRATLVAPGARHAHEGVGAKRRPRAGARRAGQRRLGAGQRPRRLLRQLVDLQLPAAAIVALRLPQHDHLIADQLAARSTGRSPVSS